MAGFVLGMEMAFMKSYTVSEGHKIDILLPRAVISLVNIMTGCALRLLHMYVS